MPDLPSNIRSSCRFSGSGKRRGTDMLDTDPCMNSINAGRCSKIWLDNWRSKDAGLLCPPHKFREKVVLSGAAIARDNRIMQFRIAGLEVRYAQSVVWRPIG